MHADGALAAAPIALVEAQGYAYAAWRGAAELAALRAEPDASAFASAADRLREAFNRDFWMEHEGLALDGAKRRCEVIASNVGHALWTGIVDERRAFTVAKRLLDEDMFSGWGIRTLSSRERRYNPMSYHNGSVWPHDNALAAAGFRRYRLGEHVLTVATSLLDASGHFDNARLPCGFPRRPDHGPVSYPVACAPHMGVGQCARAPDCAPRAGSGRRGTTADAPESGAAAVAAPRGDRGLADRSGKRGPGHHPWSRQRRRRIARPPR